MTRLPLQHDTVDLALRLLVVDLVKRSGLSQRDLVERSGLSKDQLCRAMSGKRQLSLDEALAILNAAGLPARGTVMLALFHHFDPAEEYDPSNLAGFLEALVSALPGVLAAEIGDDRDRVDPRWGAAAARFVAQRIAHHIRELLEREQRLGDFSPGLLRSAS